LDQSLTRQWVTLNACGVRCRATPGGLVHESWLPQFGSSVSTSIAIAVALRDAQPAEVLATIPNDVAALIKRLERLGPAESLRCCYEAGPTGFGLARRLIKAGIACEVIAPPGKAVVAVARELAGFVWVIAREEVLLAS
jgi:hypothetical protein